MCVGVQGEHAGGSVSVLPSSGPIDGRSEGRRYGTPPNHRDWNRNEGRRDDVEIGRGGEEG
jgi:hypothetical protein